MIKRIGAMVAVAVTVGQWAASGASAQEPVAGCGAGYELGTIAESVDAIDERAYTPEEWTGVVTAVTASDLNGDGYLCTKQLKSNPAALAKFGFDRYLTNVSDNRAAGRV